MENKTIKINVTLRMILITIALGIWVIVLQNAGIIPTKQNVYVKGGYLNAKINDKVEIEGGVDINSVVDVNLEQINGHSNAFYDFSGNKDYVRIPVYLSNY